jgi:nucleoside-diphosphate-sugar epimerase
VNNIMTDASQSERASVTPLQPGTAVAVTGATGFIGGRLVERLIEQGAVVTCLVRNPAASARLHEMGAQTHLLNIAEPEPLHLALAGIDLVFHCAYDWENTNWNLSALRALIEACRANSRHHLVHVSSVVVYQKPAEGELTEKCAEDTSTAGYAHTKRELEHELFMAARDDGLSMTIIQPTIVYGPFCRSWTIRPAEMLRYGTVILPDHGEGICNAVYVDDVVSALIIAARHPRAIGQRFLISGPPITWRQFYEEIARAVGAKGPQYRPAKVIALRNHGKVGKLLCLVADPGWVIPLAAQKLVRVGLGVLPEGIRRRAENRLLGPITRRLGHVYLPSLRELTSLQSRATVGSAKARRELGYAPQFDFGKGMIPTARFLREVYLNAEDAKTAR